MLKINIKFLTTIVMLLLMSLFATFSVFADELHPDVTVTANYVRVRMGPDTGYSIIGYVHNNEIYHTLGRDTTGFWVQIEYRGMEGWVSVHYTSMDRPELLAQPVSEVVIGRITSDLLKLRSEPLYDAPVIDVLVRGEMLNLLGRDDGGEWVYVQTEDGSLGWVARFYLNIGEEIYFLRIPLLSSMPGVGANVNPQ